MAEHKFHSGCSDEDHCYVCRGGLGWCDVCGCGEGTLPTVCPGKRLTAQDSDDIYAGILDYVEQHGEVLRVVRVGVEYPWLTEEPIGRGLKLVQILQTQPDRYQESA